MTTPDARSPQERLTDGLERQKRGELDAAIADYQAAAEGPPVVASEALRRMANVYRLRSEWDRALEYAQRAADVAFDAGEDEVFAEATNVMGVIHQARGDFDGAMEHFEQVLAISRDEKVRGMALQNEGSIAAQRGDFEAARRLFLESAGCYRRVGYTLGEAIVLNNFGRAAIDFGNFRVAAPMLEEAGGAARRVADHELIALVTMNYAEAIAGMGDLARARELAAQAHDAFVATGNTWRRVEALRLLGDIAARGAEPAAARAHYEEALALARQIGAAVEVEQLGRRLGA